MYNLREIRPAWAEIDLDSLAHNMREIRRLVKRPTMITAVLKANGYGHGAVEIAGTLLENGAERLAVAILDEGVELRKAGYTVPVLILGYTDAEQSGKILEYDLEQTVYTLENAEALSREAVSRNKTAKIHIKIDTGMGRIGFKPNGDSINTIKKISKLPGIKVEGIFTHFSSADSKDKSFTEEQYEKFRKVCGRLDEAGVKIPLKHAANSAAIIDLPDMYLDMVRAGIILYGLAPAPEMLKKISLRPVMSLKARIANVKEIRANESVGYGETFTASGPTKIATVPVGYGDGYPRRLSGKASVLINGVRAPVVGRICMDQCMVNVTGIDPIRIGDEVVLFGSQKGGFISADELAEAADTISYEIVSAISRRIPRVYIKNGQITEVANYLVTDG